MGKFLIHITETKLDIYIICDLIYNISQDYGGAEFESMSIDNCLCGTEKCRGDKIGFKLAHDKIRSQYEPYYASYLHNWKEQP
jgi:hypothetical protein